MSIIEASDARAAGVVIALDRQERGMGELSAIQEVELDYGISVISVVKLCDIVNYYGNASHRFRRLDGNKKISR